jgi:putative transposase
MLCSFQAAVAKARRERSLLFASLVSEESILEAFGSARWLWQGWIYSPAVTVWVFLSQCLSMDHSCRDAVARLITWRVARGLRPCSADTGGYCTAREALPEMACHQLVRQTGSDLEREAPAEWLWHKRRVRVVDGSTITMPDTAANQAKYPQMASQKPGCGFPIARIVVVFSLSVGTVLEAALGKYEGKKTGENSLFRTLKHCLDAGDVVVIDRYFSGWCDLALLQARGVDVVVRKHQRRHTDFREGKRLGKDDHRVCWPKPPRPKWMTRKTYVSLPAELTLREVRVRVTQKGFRTKELDVVTTLLDPVEYPPEEIAELYRRRWHAELNLRSLKTVLQMDHLRCKTPHRVRNEFFMHLVAYNLIRRLMALSAQERGTQPWQVSFKGALQTVNVFLPILCSSISPEEWCTALVASVATHVVGDRPDRYEPRVKKRRAKEYDLMNKPRAEYKRQMAK